MMLAPLLTRMDGDRFQRWSRSLLLAAACACGVSVLTLSAVLLVPRHDDITPAPTPRAAERNQSTTQQSDDASVLLARLASRPLMGAPAAAGTRDDSSALSRVLATLTLAGTVADGPAPMAYVMLPGGQMKTVRPGERLLQFTVEGIEKSRVTLRADGNRYVLTYK